MKLSFRQWLNRHSSSFPGWVRGKLADVHKNPSREDLLTLSAGDQTRVKFDGDDVYAWYSRQTFHSDVHKHLRLPSNAIHGYLDHNDKLAIFWHAKTTALANHPYLKKLGYTPKKQ